MVSELVRPATTTAPDRGPSDVLDFGPGAGDRGGEITAQGTPKQVMRAKASLTGQYLSNRRAIPVPTNRRITEIAGHPALTVTGARHNNLKNLDVAFLNHVSISCLSNLPSLQGAVLCSL